MKKVPVLMYIAEITFVICTTILGVLIAIAAGVSWIIGSTLGVLAGGTLLGIIFGVAYILADDFEDYKKNICKCKKKKNKSW